MTAVQSVEEVQTRLVSAEKSIFNIAMLVAYGTGVTIPAHTDEQGNEHAEATVEKKIKQVDYIKLVGRSKQAIQRWCGAMKLIIENDTFHLFASGKVPFQYDKIYIIYNVENRDFFKTYNFEELFTMSVDTLEALAAGFKAKKSSDYTDDEQEQAEQEQEQAEQEQAEKTTFTYNGKQFEVDKKAFEKWIAKNAKFVEVKNEQAEQAENEQAEK